MANGIYQHQTLMPCTTKSTDQHLQKAHSAVYGCRINFITGGPYTGRTPVNGSIAIAISPLIHCLADMIT